MANLGKLIKQADAAAESASRLVLRAMREVRGELALLADELNLTGSAADRDKAYQMIQKKMARLSRRLDALMDAQNHLAGKTAAKSAEEMTGLEVKYSAARANAIIELVTPAQGENLAAVFTQNMAANSIRALQEATVAVMREQAVAGGTMKEMKKALGERWQKAISAPPVFTDAGGHTWDTGAYLQMNIRTNTMRVYNDCLVDDVARTTGSDLVRVSTGGDPMCRHCAPWEGVILSVSGKTKGFPTYEQARQAGCFHPNCVHTIETVDDVWDGDEIELQKAHPVTKETATDPDAMDERKYKMDQERYRRKGMDAEAARLAVDRDNLEANIRHGLIRSDARAIVDKLTDAQITALCKDGNPPRFEPTKKATKKNPHAADEKFIHGKRGGVVHISRTATVEDLVKVTGIKDAKMPEPAKVEKPKAKADLPVDFDNLPQDQKDALEWYVSGEGQYINQALRGRVGADFGELTAAEKESIDAIRKATDHPLDKNIKTLYRSVDARAVLGNISETQYQHLCDYFLSSGADRKYYEKQIGGILERSKGKDIEEKGFMSTTQDKNVALEWSGFTGSDMPITLELKVAPDTKGIDLKKLDVEDMQQKEVLLHTGIKYRIAEITHVDGVPYVKAEIIGEKKADAIIAVPNANNDTISDGQKLANNYKTKTWRISNEEKPEALAKAIEDVGKRIKDFDVEHMVVLNPDGTTRFDEFISTPTGGPIPKQWKGSLKGATLIHNHPGLGDGLSNKDIFTAKSEGLRTIQAVSKKATYTLTVDKWPTKEILENTWDKVESEVVAELSRSNLSFVERMYVVQDRIVAQLAKELSLLYTTSKQ